MTQSSNTLGRYQIIREIARSNDIVYEAIDPAIGRRIALKELQIPPNLVGSAKRERIERFYREAKAAGTLTHPNIVTIFEVGEDAGRHFIAMEFLEGQTLQDTIDIRGALPPAEARGIVLQVLEALAFAHKHGIIHRDIKPANIQLLPGGVVKLTDFGIARIMHEPSITASGQIFGTPSYMSPEQIAGRDIDQRSDLFSLGVVLYEALTASKPFTGDSVVTITYNIMNMPATRPAGVPDGLADIVQKALAKDPAARYQSAQEFADALTGDWDRRGPQIGQAPPPIFFPSGQGPQAPAPGFPGQGPSPAPSPNLPPPRPLPPPPPPPGPFMTPGEAAGLRAFFVTVILAAAVLLAIWGINAAYENYKIQGNDARAAEYFNSGTAHYNAGRYDQAIEEYQRALSTDLSERLKAEARRAIGACYVGKGQNAIQAGNFASAAQSLGRALDFHPESGNAYYLLGVVSMRQGQLTPAIRCYEQAVSLDPESDGGRKAAGALQEYYWNRAAQYSAYGRTGGAMDCWKKIVEIDPSTNLALRAQAELERALLR